MFIIEYRTFPQFFVNNLLTKQHRNKNFYKKENYLKLRQISSVKLFLHFWNMFVLNYCL